jgi:LysM repeat protein
MMPEQLKEMNPDMICIDLGANDFYPKTIDKPVFEDNLRNIIKLMKGVCPGVSIIVTCSQDIYCRKKNIAECKAFAQIARNIAFEMQCGFYDYYHISGGQYAMNKWYVQKLAKPDRVHLTAEGYYVKGELYFNAMLKSYVYWLQNPSEPLIRDVSAPEIEENNAAPERDIPAPPAQASHTYTVQSGDNLGKIAMRFGTSVSQIKDWNQLDDDNIRIGQKLKIHSAQPAIRTQPHQSTPQSPAKGGITYTVKSGDSLWSISQKYKTTADKIRKLNGLKSDKLVPGMKLRMP